jgi:hypothetical protein
LFALLFLALGEGASRDFGHKCEPFLCVDVDYNGDCLCLCWELFICPCVSWVFPEGHLVCYLCKSARVEVACSAYYNEDDLDLESFFSVVSQHSLF